MDFIRATVAVLTVSLLLSPLATAEQRVTGLPLILRRNKHES
jgi:hypothetical protein